MDPLIRTAHLCVDMQNVFAEDTAWRTPWMDRVLPDIVRLARHNPARTIFTRFMPPERAEDAPRRWRLYFSRWREMTRERIDPRLLDLVPALAELIPPARIIDKPVYSPFSEPDLLAQLQDWGTETLVVTGVETDVCVLAAVIAAIDHGFRVVVPKDALCGSADQTHDALVTVYRTRFGQQVELSTVDDVIESWSPSD